MSSSPVRGLVIPDRSDSPKFTTPILQRPKPTGSVHVDSGDESAVIGHHQHPSPNIPSRSSDIYPSPFPPDDVEDEWAPPNRSSIYQLLLTLVMCGIQISWSVELAYINPYLLSLGLPKSTLSLIWIAGPVSGVVVQPIIGLLSDRSKFKWGRRRIFIVISTIACVLGFIGLGRTREIVRFVTGKYDWQDIRNAVIVLAIGSLIVLDVAINASITCSSSS
jgi:hypothetical protein